MIILGEKYKFTALEKAKLCQKFQSFDVINYKNMNTSDILFKIENTIKYNQDTLIVLNTQEPVDNNLIAYLTNLKFNNSKPKLRIVTIEHFLETYLFKCYIPDSNDDLHFLEDIQPYNIFEYIAKRACDYLGSFCLLVLTFPILMFAKYKVMKDSPGPILYKQARVGINNQEFICLKLRSMQIDAEKNGAQFASENDLRIFPWGETMRKMRIDELPQIINVLKGDMHLIGPRPERKIWTETFEQTIPYYNERHIVRPGITGWAQVMYPYGSCAEDARQKLMYDLYYIKKWNILLELKIIIKTIYVVFKKKGV